MDAVWPARAAVALQGQVRHELLAVVCPGRAATALPGREMYEPVEAG